jgi:hypothetical protein
VQEINDVEVGDHRVGQLDEGAGEQFGVHQNSPSRRWK